jgi:alpha-1,3/alpha-1,6-mannosyltransferase
VTFIHPDLGLGGAERLIVDAAVGLQQKGYQVSIITGYHDPNRAFPETVNGTLQVDLYEFAGWPVAKGATLGS